MATTQATTPTPVASSSPVKGAPAELAGQKNASSSTSCSGAKPPGGALLSGGGKSPALAGGGGGLGKLAALMKKSAGPPAKGSAASPGIVGKLSGSGGGGGADATGAGGGGGGGGLMGMFMLKKKLNKWRTSKLKTWNMNDSTGTTSTVRTTLENTYRLEPEETGRFLSAKVKTVIEDVLRARLRDDMRYNPATFAVLSRLVADEIKTEVKALGFNRYKLVVHVLLAQNLTQGLQTASRCVWDLSTDNSATVTFRNHNVCAVINVFGCYFE